MSIIYDAFILNAIEEYGFPLLKQKFMQIVLPEILFFGTTLHIQEAFLPAPQKYSPVSGNTHAGLSVPAAHTPYQHNT
jgi:hypothetical protein